LYYNIIKSVVGTEIKKPSSKTQWLISIP